MRKISTTIAEEPAPPVLTARDFGRIKGQEAAKRAVMIAIAGLHPIALAGPPGQGKTMLIEAAKVIEPRFTAYEATIWQKDRPNGQASSQLGRRLYHLCRCTDIQVEVPRLSWREVAGTRPGTDTAAVLKQVGIAREFHRRHGDSLGLNDACLLLAKQAYEELGLTPASHDAVVRVARTIADLDQSESIQEQHVAEAVQYRLLDHRA